MIGSYQADKGSTLSDVVFVLKERAVDITMPTMTLQRRLWLAYHRQVCVCVCVCVSTIDFMKYVDDVIKSTVMHHVDREEPSTHWNSSTAYVKFWVPLGRRWRSPCGTA